MTYCLNPDCQNPQNPNSNVFCFSCGTKLIPLLSNRYRVIQPLGRGGFAKTYLAEDTRRLNTGCVIKQFSPLPEIQRNPQALQTAVKLFNQEAERLLQLEDHPQIPTMFDFFEQDNRLYLVMQLIKGHNLLDELKKQGAFTETKIRELLLDLLPILQFIHHHKVIHRDIKPDNMMRRQSDGKLVLIDFGISKQLQGTVQTRVGTTTGTPGYAASEQMMYGEAYPASDLYSLGATCVHLLTGNHPLSLFNVIEARWLWRDLLLQNNARISNNLELVLNKLLKDIRERYQSADEVLKDLNSRNIFEFDVITVNAQGKQINSCHCQAEFLPEDLGNGITLEMVFIPAGKFMMGSPDTEQERSNTESPQHQVTVAPFFLGKTPVTQAQWKIVAALPQINRSLNPDPSSFTGANRPVENVSWDDAMEFCARLAKKTGRDYRLPSEAQWEYAARAETTTPFHFGETITPELANYNGDFAYESGAKGKYRQETTVVESFQVANAFGLYDMHGLVWEWCADFWHENYSGAPSDGTVWEVNPDDRYRMLRGGSWLTLPRFCRSACRSKQSPDYKYRVIGFRVAVSVV